MYSVLKSFVFFITVFAVSAYAGSPLVSKMERKDSSFVLTVNFTTELPREKLMEVLLTYEHTKNYVKQPSLKISLVREEPRFNIIKYHYNYLVSKMDMAIENRVSPDYNHFTFRQTSFYRSNRLIPEVLSSGGRYDVLKVENGRAHVRYTQYGKMDQKISGIFQEVIKAESVGFIKDLLKYIEKLEASGSAVASSPEPKSKS